MKVGIIGKTKYPINQIVEAILSNDNYELVYTNISNSNLVINYDDLDNYINDLDIVFTVFENSELNKYFEKKYTTKIKQINLENYANILLAC